MTKTVADLIREVGRQCEADGRALRREWEMLRDRLEMADADDCDWDWDGDDYSPELLPPSPWVAMTMELAKRA